MALGMSDARKIQAEEILLYYPPYQSGPDGFVSTCEPYYKSHAIREKNQVE
jgi:hypothetical protein